MLSQGPPTGCNCSESLHVWMIYRSCCSKSDVVSDTSVRKLVADQMAQWSEMMERHRKEEWGVLKAQVDEQKDHLVRIIEQVQAVQMKQLEGKHERSVPPLVIIIRRLLQQT